MIRKNEKMLMHRYGIEQKNIVIFGIDRVSGVVGCGGSRGQEMNSRP